MIFQLEWCEKGGFKTFLEIKILTMNLLSRVLQTYTTNLPLGVLEYIVTQIPLPARVVWEVRFFKRTSPGERAAHCSVQVIRMWLSRKCWRYLCFFLLLRIPKHLTLEMMVWLTGWFWDKNTQQPFGIWQRTKKRLLLSRSPHVRFHFRLWLNQDFNHVMIMRSLFCNMKRSVSKFFHHTRKLGDKARPEDFVDIIIKQLRPIRLDASSWQDKASLPTHQSYFLPQSLHRRCVSLQINQELLNARVGNITPQQKPRASLTKKYKWLLLPFTLI